MAWADLSDVQVRMRERIKELRCILRAERGRRVRDRHGLSSSYKSGGGQFDRRKTIRRGGCYVIALLSSPVFCSCPGTRLRCHHRVATSHP